MIRKIAGSRPHGRGKLFPRASWALAPSCLLIHCMKPTALFAGVLFAIAHTQSPLYYSNQNQYFLHGLADAGYGYLDQDWLANTDEPTPLFSAFVSLSFRTLGPWVFQVVFFLALVGYFLALWGLVRALPFGPRSAWAGWGWSAAIIISHAGLVRWASYPLAGADYPWFLQCGLANQYVLGPGLQPSVVGILLIAAVTAYAWERPILAGVLAAGANIVHTTYLLPAGMLVAGFMVGELLQRRVKSAFLTGGLALLIVAPVIVYSWLRFGPSDPEAFARAQDILANVRIPHHARPARWYDAAAGFQLVWLALGILALRGSRLFVPVLVTTALAGLGTAIVMITENPTAALVFPWRVSAVLIPIATAALFARVCALCQHGVQGTTAEPLPFRPLPVLLLTLVAIGSAAAVYAWRLGFREPEAEDPALAYVQEHAQREHVYLVPARFPGASNARGVYSATYSPPPNPNAPVFFEMARFRIATGAALYVDFKSIPYAAADVLEWNRRVEACERWFADPHWDDRGILAELEREGITHVVAPTKLALQSSRLELLFEGGAYRVYRITPAGG